ncbi:hypothetical protein [Salmonella phage SD-6_S16]|nr:hypothetical protein [Salmonella phage SD-6_S16]
MWCDKLGRSDVSPRWVLQNYGTNILRKYFHNDIWVFSLEKSMQEIDGNIIITDCRFPNELKMIRSQNGNPDIIVQNNSTIDDLHKKAMDIIYSNT